jgi:hypothetical protein
MGSPIYRKLKGYRFYAGHYVWRKLLLPRFINHHS